MYQIGLNIKGVGPGAEEEWCCFGSGSPSAFRFKAATTSGLDDATPSVTTRECLSANITFLISTCP